MTDVLRRQCGAHGATVLTLFALSTGPVRATATDLAADRSPSPEVIHALSDMLKVVQGSSFESWISPEGVKATAEFLSAVSWPVVIVFIVLLFRRQIRDFIGGVDSVSIGESRITRRIQREIDSSASERLASPQIDPQTGPTQTDQTRAASVAALAEQVDPNVIRDQVDKISAEYEAIRASMLSGQERTRRMGAVMAKMRALGRAVFPFRSELINHPSPGKRLFVVAALQMIPDYGLVDWLASRMSEEVPYIQFQALIALLVAVRNAGPGAASVLRAAAAKTKAGRRLTIRTQVEGICLRRSRMN